MNSQINSLLSNSNIIHKFKVILVGNEGVGKTSLIMRYLHNQFQLMHNPTVGVDFFSKNNTINGQLVRLQLWDTAGAERFRSLTPSFLKEGNLAIILIDLTNMKTVQNLSFWINFVREHSQNCVIYVVANKIDLKSEISPQARQIAQQKAEKEKLFYREVSAKTSTAVQKLFLQIAQKLLKLKTSKTQYIIVSNKKQSSQENQIQINQKSQTQILKEKLYQAQTQLKQALQQKQKLETKIESLLIQSRENKIKTEQTQKFNNNSLGNYRLRLFQNDIFTQQDQHIKDYLIDTLESHEKSPIIKTKLIYRFDLKNSVNFHQYIDNIPHFIMIARTTKDMLIAAYSEAALSQQTSENKSGLIISLTNKKCFNLKENTERYKAIVYQKQHLIFGNSEIRLKSGSQYIYSNLNYVNRFYDNKGFKVDILFNEQDKIQVELKYYEIYQVIFERKQQK